MNNINNISSQPAASAEPVIRYDGIYDYASANRLNYGHLCKLVRDAVVSVPVAAQAQQDASTENKNKEIHDALSYWLGCWEAAEAEGLIELLAEARTYSQNTVAGRLADLIERRISYGVDPAREALSSDNL